MDYTLFTAALLGLIEGLTEFLPVSSTGHLILFGDLLNFASPPGKVFEIVIQLGAVLAVVVVYWRKLLSLLLGLPKDRNAQQVTGTLIVGFLPAMVIGAIFHPFIKEVLFNPDVVSIALILGGVILIMSDRLEKRSHITSLEAIPWRTGLKIGFLQCVAMIPGVSRSGATILSGMVFGLDKRTAAEYSFFLAIPTMCGAVAFDLYKNWSALTVDSWVIIGLGFVTAFLSGLVVIKTLLKFLTKHGFAAFGYYRIALGLLFIAILHL